MFTWICPQCGREVPPAYTDCPDCAAKAAQAAAGAPPPETASVPPPAQAAPPAPPSPPPPQAAPPQAAPPAPPQAPPPPYPAPQYATSPLFAAAPAPPEQVLQPPPPRGSHLPAWLMTIVFTLAIVGLGAVIYWGVNYMRGSNTTASPAPMPLESPAAKGGGKPHPLAKYLEVAGVRFTGDKKETVAKFLLINHSEAEIANLAANVTIWGRTQRSEEDPVGTLSFKIADLGPNESKEVTAPLVTKLKIYELPDWQNVATDVQITSPPAP